MPVGFVFAFELSTSLPHKSYLTAYITVVQYLQPDLRMEFPVGPACLSLADAKTTQSRIMLAYPIDIVSNDFIVSQNDVCSSLTERSL